MALGKLHESFLGEVGVVFDLEGRWRYLGVAEEIHDELAVEVADADGFGHTLAHKLLHGRPRLLDGSVARDDVFAIIGEAGRVTLRRVDVFEGNWEVDNVEVEVVDTPICQLLFTDGFNSVVVVEGIPKFGDKEEVGAFDQAFFNCASDALTGFLLVAII